ncbi:formate--phosphoribosylaminoimidazolecarboxamide ligase family protein [Candidatus Nitrosotalea okcheonensis]|uniref:5-formaminoimidazole-4-carboxamide-1-(Beta)-D-ribofuranosyl 5'-monophosphate synthetase n=1 Tax=Candidatus Nitrosotalea okcheonensis TaxID=1903276 RepID=A0A2H1FCW1_9ARCH|nr:formate--phosphoribosylaminoimidazolecarboxamide ligase family protein [Candidatus Nitrosotalea okcheonensis]MDE1728119.1 formate--phosphoribosylaminoimidazolecarboxamide ligase family protein [Nitrososphaerota archaeon]MDE1830878.1 formate--phosphoribosylaminoimidazolecarboxamide ligase family protein [Nitrososphaerota archaeon]MDE1877100.1 formate--phosphoribosylaminoimidazolecarboxamide ligase family protein [Nitrososphaerota archaeon]SMH70587.1 5-formaminoimidazole-4-carboxamide-1-(beta)
MIRKSAIVDIVNKYSELTIGALGSHSALEIMDGAKDENFKTVVVCQKGRDVPYRRFSRLADDIIIVKRFQDMLSPKIQSRLRDSGTIVVPHRALTAYLGYDGVENKFKVPLFGNRALFQAEERANKKNQYYLLQKARIRFPRLFKDPKDIDRPVIVKVQEKKRKLERAFFNVSSYAEYRDKTETKIKQGLISRDALKTASIEEFIIGTYFNFNYFHTPISKEVDFLGIERRLQTNLHDFVSLPAKQQLETNIELQNIEVGHTPASIRESLLEQVIDAGDKFVNAVKKEYAPGIIGPFSLQSVITRDLDIVVYDVSLRVPGNPILATTSPYTKYKYGETFGVGRRIAMELRIAQQEGKLEQVLT